MGRSTSPPIRKGLKRNSNVVCSVRITYHRHPPRVSPSLLRLPRLSPPWARWRWSNCIVWNGCTRNDGRTYITTTILLLMCCHERSRMLLPRPHRTATSYRHPLVRHTTPHVLRQTEVVCGTGLRIVPGITRVEGRAVDDGRCGIRSGHPTGVVEKAIPFYSTSISYWSNPLFLPHDQSYLPLLRCDGSLAPRVSCEKHPPHPLLSLLPRPPRSPRVFVGCGRRMTSVG